MPDPSDENTTRQDELSRLVHEEASLLSALMSSNRHSESMRRSIMIALGLECTAAAPDPTTQPASPAPQPAQPQAAAPATENDQANEPEPTETIAHASWPIERWSAQHLSQGPHALVVDDMPMVRDHTQRLLERLGYNVICADNGPMALRVASDMSQLDLLVTDIVMPLAMNGRELADKLNERFPETKVVFVSGFADLGVDERVGLPPTASLLAKPFTRCEFNEAIHRAMGTDRPDAPTPH